MQNQKAEQLVFPLNQDSSGPKQVEQVVAGWKVWICIIYLYIIFLEWLKSVMVQFGLNAYIAIRDALFFSFTKKDIQSNFCLKTVVRHHY